MGWTPCEDPSWIEGELGSDSHALVAWDAPISFSPANGFSDRPVHRAVRAFIAGQRKDGRIARGAVSALPFAGCPHWAISCAALRRPFGHTRFQVPNNTDDLLRTGRRKRRGDTAWQIGSTGLLESGAEET